MTGMLFSARNCCTTSDVWLGAFAPSHTSPVVQQFLAEENIPVITQPPKSPDLAPSDFRLFPTLKMGLKGTHFATMEDTKWNTTAELAELAVSYSENGPQGTHFAIMEDMECDGRTAEDSKRSLPPVFPTMAGSMEQVCLCAQGSYFEGD
jgi:hypothetical protein